jgi:hypothetical protein
MIYGKMLACRYMAVALPEGCAAVELPNGLIA